MIRFVRDTFVWIALAPLLIAVAVFLRTLWVSRSARGRRAAAAIDLPAAVFAGAIGLNALLLFVFIRPAFVTLAPESYVAAMQDETARGHDDRAAEVAQVASTAYPDAGSDLSSIATSVLLRTEQCDALEASLSRPDAIANQQTKHRSLLNLARAIRVCGLRVKENPGTTRLLASLEPWRDKREEYDLLRMEIGLASDMSDLFRRYSRAVAAPGTIRGDALIEGVTTHPGDAGREELTVYFRPLSNWQGRRLWVHAYQLGSREYVDVPPDLPRFSGWRKGELAWEVFQTPDARPVSVYVGVAVGDDLGPAVEVGSVGGS